MWPVSIDFPSVDLWSLLILTIVLNVVGNWTCQSSSRLLLWSQRAGVGVFLLWLFWSITEWGIDTPGDFLPTVLQGAVVGAFVTGLLRIVLPVASWLYETCLVSPRRRLRTVMERWNHRRAEQRRSTDRPPRKSPQQEQAERETREQEERRRRVEQARRQALEYELRLFYDQFRLELREKFPQEQFESYFKTFLTDSTPVEIYEQRAEQLRQMLRDRLDLSGAEHRPEFQSIEQILEHFRQQMERVRRIEGLDPDTLDTLLCTLEDAQDNALQEFLS